MRCNKRSVNKRRRLAGYEYDLLVGSHRQTVNQFEKFLQQQAAQSVKLVAPI